MLAFTELAPEAALMLTADKALEDAQWPAGVAMGGIRRRSLYFIWIIMRYNERAAK